MFWARLFPAFISAPYTVSSSSKAMAARRSTLGIVHTFSGMGLDRSRVETELKEAVAFEKALKSDGAGKLSGNGVGKGRRGGAWEVHVYQRNLGGIQIEPSLVIRRTTLLSLISRNLLSPHFRSLCPISRDISIGHERSPGNSCLSKRGQTSKALWDCRGAAAANQQKQQQ